MPDRYLVLNGPHAGQWHRPPGAIPQIRLIKPLPNQPFGGAPQGSIETVDYDLQRFVCGGPEGHKAYSFWMLVGTDADAIAIMDAVMVILGELREVAGA